MFDQGKKIHTHPNLEKRGKGIIKESQVVVDAEIQSTYNGDVDVDVEITKKLQEKGIISRYHIVIPKEEFERILESQDKYESPEEISPKKNDVY